MFSQKFSRYGIFGRFFFGGDEGGGGGGGSGDQTDWKQKYDDLQAKINSGEFIAKASYVKLQQNLETAVNERKTAETARDEALARVTTLERGTETLQTEINGLKETGTKKDTELTKANTQLERHNIIFKQFPALAKFEADGLLPQIEIAQLPEKLTAFQEAWFNNQEEAAKNFKKGSSPEKPEKKDGDGEGGRSVDVIRAEMFTASRTGKQEDYEKLRTELSATLKRQDK